MIKVWRLPFLVKAWVDGDTAHGVIDFGWGMSWEPPKGIRLLLADGDKYDAPERKSPTLTRGNRAKVYAQVLAPAGTWVMITSHYVDPDDFGRPLCSIELEGGQDMAAAMIAAGHVK